MSRLLRRFRPLLMIYGLVVLAALYEIAALRGVESPTARSGRAKRLEEMLRDDREVQLLGRLYPERRDTNYLEGLRDLMRKDGPPDLVAARRHFERALAADAKDEDLLYAYALTLDLLGEDPVLVDAAVDDWRRSFPFSTRPDPRAGRSRSSGASTSRANRGAR
jgi:hypothetical protein